MNLYDQEFLRGILSMFQYLFHFLFIQTQFFIQFKKYSIFFVFLSMIFIGFGCAKPTHSPKNNPLPQEKGGYPHSAEFKINHGKSWATSSSTCQDCHSGKSGVKAPLCTQCHTNYPHKFHFKEHGALYLKDPSQCQTCHIKNEKKEQITPLCQSCHPFPHTTDWSKKENHGEAFLELRHECSSCHLKQNENGERPAPQCTQCHLFPHPPGWAHPGQHGKYYGEVLPPNEKSQCKACHEAPDKESIPSCASCHVKIPHDPAFKMGKHKTIAKSYEGKCTQCHIGFKKYFSPNRSCFLCHGQRHVITWERNINRCLESDVAIKCLEEATTQFNEEVVKSCMTSQKKVVECLKENKIIIDQEIFNKCITEKKITDCLVGAPPGGEDAYKKNLENSSRSKASIETFKPKNLKKEFKK